MDDRENDETYSPAKRRLIGAFVLIPLLLVLGGPMVGVAFLPFATQWFGTQKPASVTQVKSVMFAGYLSCAEAQYRFVIDDQRTMTGSECFWDMDHAPRVGEPVVARFLDPWPEISYIAPPIKHPTDWIVVLSALAIMMLFLAVVWRTVFPYSNEDNGA